MACRFRPATARGPKNRLVRLCTPSDDRHHHPATSRRGACWTALAATIRVIAWGDDSIGKGATSSALPAVAFGSSCAGPEGTPLCNRLPIEFQWMA